MKIEDNFLPQPEFDELQTIIMNLGFPWLYDKFIVYDPEKGEGEDFQFTHTFFYGGPMSQYIENLNPILKIINPVSIFRIKANLLTKTSNIIENEFHVDMDILSDEKLKHWTTSIFYMNTNNGYTKFEDGTKVESVANRLVSFPANKKHTGTSCTDEKIRVVLNFNYFI